MSKIKALILDAGGVLVHPYHGDWYIPVKYREYLGEYAGVIGSEKWQEACRAEAHYVHEGKLVADTGEEYILRMEFLKAVAQRMGWELSDDALTALNRDFTYNTDRHAWYDDVEPWLKAWSEKLRLGILSDAMPSFLDVIAAHPARNYIEKTIVSSALGVTKPDARMYAAICNALEVDPADCLFVDDRVCNLEGAMACGMRAVQMCRDGLIGWDGDKVHDLCELNAYVEGLN